MSLKAIAAVLGLSIITYLILASFQHDPAVAQAGESEKPKESIISEASLGRLIFSDTSLSHPPGQACISCHPPSKGFSDPRAVSLGALNGRVGNRNAPTLMYAALIQERVIEEVITRDGQEVPAWEGGLFLDGRARDLFEQVQGPIFNPNEMNVPDTAALAAGLRKTAYADVFRRAIGEAAWLDDSRLTYYAYRALVEFLKEPLFRPFNARIDEYLAGDKSALNEAEKRGLVIFKGVGKCDDCHWLENQVWPHPLLTDHGYDNLGAPSRGKKDPGLGSQVEDPGELGKFRVPTLRNIVLTAPYMHNGSFNTLKEVMEFYNKRDVTPESWGPTDYPATVNHDDMGDLKLTDQQIDDLTSLMDAFTDRTLLEHTSDSTLPEAPESVPNTSEIERYFTDWTHHLHPAFAKESKPETVAPPSSK